MLVYAAPSGLVSGVLGTVACIGGFALMLAIGMSMAASSSSKERKALRGARVLPCGEFGRDGSRPGYCVVNGQLIPGPDGPVTAPLSGKPAVWYRTCVYREYNHFHNGNHELMRETVWRRDGGEPFALADSSGAVLVSGDLFGTPDFRHPMAGYLPGDEPIEVTVDEHTGSSGNAGRYLRRLMDGGEVDIDFRWLSSTMGARVVEFVAAPGATATALGVPRLRNGRLVLARPEPDGIHKISVRPPRQLLAKWSSDVRGSRKGALILLTVTLVCAAIFAVGLLLTR